MFRIVISVLFGVLVVSTLNRSRPRLDGRIVGGEKIEITSAPYQISLQSSNSHICGGSIINEKWILTAAHCTFNSKPSRFTIRVGSSRHNDGGILVKIKSISQHELFSYSNIDYDFSLLELEEPLEFNDNQQKINLPEQDNETKDGTICTVSGWGVTQSNIESREWLRSAKIPLVNRENCSIAYFKYGGITKRMLCAGYEEGGKDACQGDSGGPLILNDNNNRTLIGVVSWGYGCAKPSYPGVYSRVAAVRNWIKEKSNV